MGKSFILQMSNNGFKAVIKQVMNETLFYASL
jgi:hypothetical protein